MISIKKFLNKDDSQSGDAYERMALLLLQGIGLHAVEGEQMDRNSFQATIGDLQKSLAEDPSPTNILVATGAALKAMQDYNRRTSHFIQAKGMELQSIVGMLTSSMAQISTASQTSIGKLQDLQKQIEHAVMLDDMRSVKVRLSDCLESMRTESERQRTQSVRAVAEMKQVLQKAQSSKPPEASASVDADRITGLPLRAEAELAMEAACNEGAHVYAGLFVIDRIRAISTRFGGDLCNQVQMFFLQHLSGGLSPQDQFFRWGPASFLALLRREEPGDQVRKELARFLSGRIEQTFEIADRAVTLPIACTWVVVPLFESSYDQILRKLDAFTAASSGG
jgi:GGDEF domain-containing protein